MKYNIASKISLVLAVGLFSLQPIANASETANPTTIQATLIQRMQNISKQLNLTQEQKTQLRPIILNELQKIKALREDKSLLPRQKLQRLKAIREEVAPQVKAILTPEQFEKWQAIRKENRDKIGDLVRDKTKSRFKK